MTAREIGEALDASHPDLGKRVLAYRDGTKRLICPDCVSYNYFEAPITESVINSDSLRSMFEGMVPACSSCMEPFLEEDR